MENIALERNDPKLIHFGAVFLTNDKNYSKIKINVNSVLYVPNSFRTKYIPIKKISIINRYISEDSGGRGFHAGSNIQIDYFDYDDNTEKQMIYGDSNWLKSYNVTNNTFYDNSEVRIVQDIPENTPDNTTPITGGKRAKKSKKVKKTKKAKKSRKNRRKSCRR